MKKIIKDDTDELVIEVSSRLAKGSGFAALFLVAFPLVQFLLHKRMDEERLIGFIGGAVTSGLVYLVAYESSLFAFDSRTRLLTWRRKRSLSKKQGTLPFGRIEQVILESAIGNTKYSPKHRVMLRTGEGELPLSIDYEHNEINQTLAERIRSRLGLSPESLVIDSVQSLVERGLTIDAIRLLREKRGLSLTEAKSLIAQMKAPKKD